MPAGVGEENAVAEEAEAELTVNGDEPEDNGPFGRLSEQGYLSLQRTLAYYKVARTVVGGLTFVGALAIVGWSLGPMWGVVTSVNVNVVISVAITIAITMSLVGVASAI